MFSQSAPPPIVPAFMPFYLAVFFVIGVLPFGFFRSPPPRLETSSKFPPPFPPGAVCPVSQNFTREEFYPLLTSSPTPSACKGLLVGMFASPFFVFPTSLFHFAATFFSDLVPLLAKNTSHKSLCCCCPGPSSCSLPVVFPPLFVSPPVVLFLLVMFFSTVFRLLLFLGFFCPPFLFQAPRRRLAPTVI